jgi:hypothetical protein
MPLKPASRYTTESEQMGNCKCPEDVSPGDVRMPWRRSLSAEGTGEHERVRRRKRMAFLREGFERKPGMGNYWIIAPYDLLQ